MSRDEIRHAIELLHRLDGHATPGPWRDATVDGNPYGGLISQTCVRRPPPCPGECAQLHDYGGCLVAESQIAPDRRLMAVMRNVVGPMLCLLGALVDEDPLEAVKWADAVALQIKLAHTPGKWPL